MTIDTLSLKSNSDLLALAERDAELRRVAGTEGGEWAGPCPFCGGRDRFRVQPHAGSGGRWLCRHCTEGKWQDVIGYVMRRESCDFKSACERLGAIEALPSRQRRAAPALPERTGPPSAEWQAAAREVIAVCERNLWAADGERARDWLHGRGLADDTLRHWHIGYNPGGHKEWRDVAGLSVPCGVVIPCEIGGNVWYVKVRRAKGEPKYIQVKGSRPALFGAETLRGQSLAVMCEGEFDALLLWQEAGSLAGIATMGSATGRLDVGAWAEYLLPLSRLLVAYDLDGAGNDGAAKLTGLTHRARLVSVPQLREGDKDLTDYYKAGGNFREWLSAEVARHGDVTANRPADVTANSPDALPPMSTLPDSTAPDDDTGDPFAGKPFEPEAVLPPIVTANQDELPPIVAALLSDRQLAVMAREGNRLTLAVTGESLFDKLTAQPEPATAEGRADMALAISAAAIREGVPCLEDGQHDSGPEGWRQYAAKFGPLPDLSPVGDKQFETSRG
jgi:hypothetical protein